MLSVNIPVYNAEVNELVQQVIRQATSKGIEFEIRIYDDGSNAEVKARNQSLQGLSHIVYKELPANLGRSAIRNKMGAESVNEYLLFIDADSKLVSDDYIETYMKHAAPGCVLCGGTVYANERPADVNKLLRWVYGRKREAISGEERNKSKGFIITSNNFFIDRKVFLLTGFNEAIGSYGHEDTLLGYDLYRQGIHPLHINNPVEHTGLEDSKVFLYKSRNALQNLLFISENLLKVNNDFSGKVRFLKQYKKLTSIIPPSVVRFFFSIFKPLMERNLTGRKPWLLMYDLYKVGYFSMLKKGT